MTPFKTILSATFALALITTTATAGGLADPVTPIQPIVVEDMKQDSSSAAIIIPLLMIALIALAASADSDDDEGPLFFDE